MVAQFGEHTENYRIVHLKWIKFEYVNYVSIKLFTEKNTPCFSLGKLP